MNRSRPHNLNLLALAFIVSGMLGATAAAAADPEMSGGSPANRGRSFQPRDASTGLTLVGHVSAYLQNGSERIQIDHIVNSRSSGTSGTLRVELWATTTVPIFGNTIQHHTLAGFTLNPLPAGYEYNNVDETVAYTAPPAGCYYLTLALEEYQNGTYYYEDLVVFTEGGTPDASGYDRFSFGGASCGGSGPCVQDAYTACLLSGRFRAIVRFRGAFDNAPADTSALLKPVTGFASPSFETAFFYFNSVDNIEMMLKMLDQGNTDSHGNPTIAVLFGSATPLRVEVTITDTLTGATRTYTSPFRSQQGATDFTAFLR